MNEEEIGHLFLDLHSGNAQEGPGDFASTQRAFELIKGLPEKPRILDVGCGPGRQTLDLLRLTEGTVTAVDNHPGYLAQLEQAAAEQGLSERVTTVAADMAALDFPAHSFDLIWSEGALYCIGFKKGLATLKPLLREGGAIAATELTWLAPGAPAEVKEFWEAAYPAMQDIQGNLTIVESAGFDLVNHFTLPESAWADYYEPLVKKQAAFLEKHNHREAALAVLALEEEEMAMYQKYAPYYGYVFYIASDATGVLSHVDAGRSLHRQDR